MVFNTCFAQFHLDWTRPVNLPDSDYSEKRFYTFTGNKIFMLDVHDFYKTDLNKNSDGSITMSFGKRHYI
jgi:hypothetical protein